MVLTAFGLSAITDFLNRPSNTWYDSFVIYFAFYVTSINYKFPFNLFTSSHVKFKYYFYSIAFFAASLQDSLPQNWNSSQARGSEVTITPSSLNSNKLTTFALLHLHCVNTQWRVCAFRWDHVIHRRIHTTVSTDTLRIVCHWKIATGTDPTGSWLGAEMFGGIPFFERRKYIRDLQIPQKNSWFLSRKKSLLPKYKSYLIF